MKYNGIELTEITTPNIDNLPKKMLVWRIDDEPCERVVCATAVDHFGGLFFIARQGSERHQGVVVWPHCAEIPKPRRATKQEFARWIAQGKGEWKDKSSDYAYVQWDSYREAEADEPCNKKIVVRKWDDTDWHEPTVDYMGIE